MQFALIFHLFFQARPMTKYEQMRSLFALLKVLNNLFKHWSDYARWEIVEALHNVVSTAIKEAILA